MANEKIKLEDIDFEQIVKDLDQNVGKKSDEFEKLGKYCGQKLA